MCSGGCRGRYTYVVHILYYIDKYYIIVLWLVLGARRHPGGVRGRCRDIISNALSMYNAKYRTFCVGCFVAYLDRFVACALAGAHRHPGGLRGRFTCVYNDTYNCLQGVDPIYLVAGARAGAQRHPGGLRGPRLRRGGGATVGRRLRAQVLLYIYIYIYIYI